MYFTKLHKKGVVKMTINFSQVWVIIKKELRALITLPTTYVILVVFLFLWEYLFFRNAFLVGEASLRSLFALLPWLFLVFIPAVTMASISQEKQQGTLELLLTRPVSALELLLGKFLAGVSFVGVVLLLSLPIGISFSYFGSMDWGVVAGQYLGGLLLAMVLVSLGVFVSSLVDTQIAAVLVSSVASFFLVMAGSDLVTASLPAAAGHVLEQISVVTHFNAVSRGVLDLRDIWYFLSAVVLFLSWAYLQFLYRRFGNLKARFNTYQVAIILFTGIVIFTNMIGGRILGRIDLTQNRLYTLSSATTDVLNGLSDVVNVTVYASSQLPPQYQSVLRDIKDNLYDYQNLGQGNLVVKYKDPLSDSTVAQEATSLGVRQVQFNVVGQEELQVKNGYLGLVVSYGDQNEVVPFVQQTEDLEYQLTSLIKKLTTTEKQTIGFLSGHQEKDLYQDYSALQSELSKQFKLQTVTMSTDSPTIPDVVRTLVIAGPQIELDELSQQAVQQFVDQGKSLLLLVDPVVINPQGLSAKAQGNYLSFLTESLGVKINSDLVYDLRSNETVNFGGGPVSYYLPYPLWIRALPIDQSSPITARISGVTIPWASSISVDTEMAAAHGFKVGQVLATSNSGGLEKNNYQLAPDANYSQADLGAQTVALSLSGSDSENSAQKARILIISDSDFLTDQFVQNSAENFAFGMSAMSWLSQENSLASIQLKQRAVAPLEFESNTQKNLIKYGNLLFIILLPVGGAVWYLTRRRGLRKFKYSSLI